MRCHFCHNPEAVLPDNIAQLADHYIPDNAIFSFLEQRQGVLDGVSICGGEPTLQHDLSSFVERIKAM
jgi:pyruvate formate lyase activating enzyme